MLTSADMRSRTTLLAAALAMVLSGAPPAAGDTLVHGDPSAENVSAHRGVLMWSRRDARGRHHLVRRIGAVVSDAPVASSANPFDPDLGPAGKGRVVAVYERCRKGLRSCDLYRLDVASGRERRIRAVSTRGGSEFGASVWGERYAFARESPSQEGLFTAVRGRTRFLAGSDVLETDLQRRTIALATYSAGAGVDFTGIYVHRVRSRGRGRSCLVDRGDQGTALNSPVLDGEYAYWHDFTADPGIVERVARADLASVCHRRPRIQFSDRTLPVGVDSIAVDGGTVYYTQGDYVDATGVYVADSPPPRFAGG